MKGNKRSLTVWICAMLMVLSMLLTLCNAHNQAVFKNVGNEGVESEADTFFRKGGNHTNNWAVLVSTSRFWFNYRHSSNVLGFYRTVKRLGIPDSNIILMIADDASCDARNIYPGVIWDSSSHEINLYGDDIEVDYRGYEVTVENFIRVLTGRHDDSVPNSKRLLSDERSNVFVYMTGHGGNEFLKFQDAEEITSLDLADAFQQMYTKNRYNELLCIFDTCQANTLYSQFYSPNILALGSSRKDYNSYSHHYDRELGTHIIDRLSYYSLNFLDGVDISSDATIQDLFTSFDYDKLHSHHDWRDDLFGRPIDEVYITEFLGSVTPVEVTSSQYKLEPNPERKVLNKPKHQSGKFEKEQIEDYFYDIQLSGTHLYYFGAVFLVLLVLDFITSKI
eukprot:TRINITY_DN10901_c0_g1_i1.p1 TRINITY_DN10901_c0_g1~~TRINITY_DN10901_c0_g1_i1.p1  ORF type:complete len:392 (-),score=74.82 TRINITY_DN10901_c0_g1_i1:34-1209(-)